MLLWTSKLVLTTCLKNLNECSKKFAHSPERTESFLTNIFLMDMFILAWGILFGPPSLEGYTEKTKKMFPGRPKKIRKSKNSFKTVLPNAHLETKEQIWYEGCKISAANQTFPCPKSKIASQSPLNVFVEVILWTRKVHFWQFCWKNLTKLEKSLLNFHLNWKKSFRKNNSTKSSRTFRMQLWQIWRNLFSELRFFFRSNTKLNETWQNFAKKIEKLFGHVECSLRNAAETFRHRSGGLSLKVRKQFWKNRKNNLSQIAPMNK